MDTGKPIKYKLRLERQPEGEEHAAVPTSQVTRAVAPVVNRGPRVPAGTRVRLFPLAVLYGIAFSVVALGLWRPHQSYPDVIAGQVAFQNGNKAADFLGLALIVALSVLSYYGILQLAKLAVRRTRGEADWLNSLLDIPLVLCAYWAGTQLIGYDATRPAEPLLAAGFLMVTLPALVRLPSPSPLLLKQAGYWLLFDLLLLAAGGFGLSFVLARVFPSLNLSVLYPSAAYAAAGCAVLTFLMWRSSSVEQCLKRLVTATYFLQIPLPLLFFAVLPRDTLFQGQRVSEAGAPLLAGALVALSITAWALLYRRFRGRKRIHGWSLRKHLQPLCLVAITICFVAAATIPTVAGDDFHFGEQFLPWQQLIQFGQLPYVDIIPIHGAMPLLAGALNSFFFQGTVASFEAASVLLGSIAAAVTFLCLYRAGGLAPALLYCLCIHQFNRLYLLGPVLFYLLQPRRFRSPGFWVAVIGLSLLAVVYNIPAGLALMIGLLPLVAQEGLRLLRGGFARVRPLLLGGSALLLIAAGVPVLRKMVLGFIDFGMEAGSTNDVAHGIPWQGIGAVNSPSPEALVSPLLFTILKFGWVLFAIAAFTWLAGKALDGLAPVWNARYRLLWGVGISVVALAPWTFGRVDPGLSRSGSFSAYCVGVFLPVLAFRYGGALRIRGFSRSAACCSIALLLGMYAVVHSGVAGIRQTASGLTPVAPVPDNLVRVNGADHNLPNLGSLYMPLDRFEGIVAFDRGVSTLVGKSGTYFDLTNRQALYCFTGRKEPVAYATTVVAASHQQQQRNLDQLLAHPEKLAYAAPAINIDGPASLRSYLLYRYAVLNYRPCKIEGNVFLVAPSPDRSKCEGGSERELLDSVFSQRDLASLPTAWGSSWQSLRPLFTSLNVPLADSQVEEQGLIWNKGLVTPGEWNFNEAEYLKRYPDIADAVRRGFFKSGYEHYRDYGQKEGRSFGLPSVIVDLRDLKVDPEYYDFLAFVLEPDQPGVTKARMELGWTSEQGETTDAISFELGGKRALVPLGSFPRWLKGGRIQSLRVGIQPPPSWQWFRVSELQLLHYRPSDRVPAPPQ